MTFLHKTFALLGNILTRMSSFFPLQCSLPLNCCSGISPSLSTLLVCQLSFNYFRFPMVTCSKQAQSQFSWVVVLSSKVLSAPSVQQDIFICFKTAGPH